MSLLAHWGVERFERQEIHFFGGFPCLFPQKKQGKEGQGKGLLLVEGQFW